MVTMPQLVVLWHCVIPALFLMENVVAFPGSNGDPEWIRMEDYDEQSDRGACGWKWAHSSPCFWLGFQPSPVIYGLVYGKPAFQKEKKVKRWTKISERIYESLSYSRYDSL